MDVGGASRQWLLRTGVPHRLRHRLAGAARLSSVRIAISDEYLEVRLAPWQKLLGLMRDIRVARTDITDVRVVADPVREAMRAGVKVGLRLPWVYFVARTIGLSEAFVVRRGVPGLSVEFAGGARLRRVLVSTPEADALARRLTAGR
jgi:hypothetical protein